jgi:chaperone required for assembly of F1-ATPase
MRDVFEDIFQNQTDPSESARRSMRSPLRKRFYEKASVGAREEAGFPILLDGKPVRTPARRALAAPTEALGAALAAEWEAQREAIDPAAMPLTRLANSIIDGVADNSGEVADDIAKYLGTDLLFYRAAEPAGLVAQHAQHWDPVLNWMHEKFGARFVLSEGVMHVAQPQRALDAGRTAIPSDPWRIGAAHAVTTLTGSALIALALAHGHLDAEAAWAAAHVDEDWQMSLWGRDELALKRRAFRWEEMKAASRVLAEA